MKIERLENKDRGQATTYVVAGATIVLFGLIYAIMQIPVDQLLEQALENCVTDACTTGVGHVSAVFTWLPLIAAMGVVLMLFAASIFKSQRPGI